MPSKSQLHLIWESKSEFFGGFGQPKENLEGGVESGGFTTNQMTDTPIVPKKKISLSSAEILGVLEYDSERKDFKLVPNPPACG